VLGISDFVDAFDERIGPLVKRRVFGIGRTFIA
jgi:hypothetical protein